MHGLSRSSRRAGLVKLDAMENPYPPAARRCSASSASGSSRVAINRYPVPTRVAELRALSRAHAACRPAASCCSATARTS